LFHRIKILIAFFSILFSLVGCTKNSPTANEDKSDTIYPPVPVFKSPSKNSTVYDSTTVNIIVFFRGDRNVNLYIDGEKKISVNSDTLRYKWIVKDFLKFSKHNLIVDIVDNHSNNSVLKDTAFVTVSHPMITFSSIQSGVKQIFIMNEDGTQVRQITQGVAESLSPAWSPFGNKIAFVSKLNNYYSIYFYNLIDSTLTKFMDGDSGEIIQDLVWSAERNQLAYSSNGRIILINADKTNKNVIFSAFYARHPSFGKNGEIFFDYIGDKTYLAVYDSAGNIGGIDPGKGISFSESLILPTMRTNSNDIYVLNSNTSELGYGMLSKSGNSWEISGLNFTQISDVDSTTFSFSPNGKMFAYVSVTDKSLYVANYNGGSVKKIYQGGAVKNTSWSRR
jgi:hypothetical protein